MTDGLKDKHREAIIATLAANDRVERAVLFGSRATGTNTQSSDVDIALFGDRLTVTDQARLAAALDEIPMAQSVDLVLYDSINSATLRNHIRAHGVELYVSRKTNRDGTVSPRTAHSCDTGNGWAERPLGQVIELKRGYDLPGRERMSGPVPVVSSSGVTGSHRESRVAGPGVVTGRYGTLGEVYFIQVDFWPLNTTLYVRDFKGNDPRYVNYLLRGLDFSGHSDKAAVPGLNRNHLHQEPVRIPADVREQRSIAHVLGTLDDRIELNRRMNATLEAMARALFRSWFVDFDPVRARMAGRATGLPKDIADLFPDRLVDSELGEIPEGWTVGTLGDIATAPRSGIDPGQVADDTPYIGLEHMPRRSVALTDWGRTGSVSSTKTAFENRDILFGKLRPYFHKVGLAPVDGVCSTDIVVLKARMVKWSTFLLACVSSSGFVSYASQTSTGTKMPRTSWRTMSRYELCQPADAVAAALQHIVSPMLERIVANVHESRTLARLRDTLLPKLVSGALRVNEMKAPAGAEKYSHCYAPR